MSKYQVLIHFPDGEDELQDEIFDTEEEAEEFGCDYVSCSRLRAEILEMSNPGDYPMDDYEEPDFEVVKAR